MDATYVSQQDRPLYMHGMQKQSSVPLNSQRWQRASSAANKPPVPQHRASTPTLLNHLTEDSWRSNPLNDIETNSEAGSDIYMAPSPKMQSTGSVEFSGSRLVNTMSQGALRSVTPDALLPQTHQIHAQHHQVAIIPRSSRDVVLRTSTTALADNHRFREDLRQAASCGTPLDRYKSFIRLFSSLRREMENIDQPSKPASWASYYAHEDLLHKIIEVGEALAVFGTAEFGERSNTSRAINIKDYAYLLKTYGEAFWVIYKQEFVDELPQSLSDSMLAVRGLLATRFEANAILQEQLIKHVGLEGQGQGTGAVVYNTSVVSANPVNRIISKPVNTVASYAQAVSKALQMGQNKWVPIAAGAIGLMILKRTGLLGFIPGMGRRRSAPPAYDDTAEEEGLAPGRRGRRNKRMSSDEKLLVAFDHVDRSYKELIKAQHDIELLKNDWRIGGVRLASPFSGPYPPGFEPLHLKECEPRMFMHGQLGMMG